MAEAHPGRYTTEGGVFLTRMQLLSGAQVPARPWPLMGLPWPHPFQGRGRRRPATGELQWLA